MSAIAKREPGALNESDAREITDQIRSGLEDVRELIVTAYHGRVWIPLGYKSWDAWVDGEFLTIPIALPREERRKQVASLRDQGLSLRAIAAVTGTDHKTASNDLLSGGENSPPARTTGSDGKSYPSRRGAKKGSDTVVAEVLYDPKDGGSAEDEDYTPSPADPGDIQSVINVMELLLSSLELYSGMDDMAETLRGWIARLELEMENEH